MHTAKINVDVVIDENFTFSLKKIHNSAKHIEYNVAYFDNRQKHYLKIWKRPGSGFFRDNERKKKLS